MDDLTELLRKIVREELRTVLREELRAEVLRPRIREVQAAITACEECHALRRTMTAEMNEELRAALAGEIHCARHGIELAIARAGRER